MSFSTPDFLYRISVCSYLTDRSSSLPLPSPETVSLLYNTDGVILLQYSNVTVRMPANSVAVLASDTDVPILLGQDWMAVLLTISGGAINAFSAALPDKTVILTENTSILSMFGDIVRINRSHSSENEILLSEHIGRLLNALLNKNRHSSRYKSKGTDGTQDIVCQCIQYVESHFSVPLSLAALAKHIGVSKYHLSRMFSSRTGMTLQDYHIACRIKESKRLLQDHTLSLSAICERIGFVDMSHFSKTFKKHAHMTPTQYRKHIFNQSS